MKKLLLCIIAVFIILGGGLAAETASAVTAQLDTGGMNFGSGDLLDIGIGIVNSDGPTPVDAYLVLILPDTTPVFFEFTGTGLAASVATFDPATWKKLLSNVMIPSGLNTGLMPVLNYRLTGAEPFGTYETIFLFTRPGTLDVLDYKTASFFIGAHPVSGILGSYSGTWTNQTFSSSGTVTFVIADSQPGFLSMTASLGGTVFGNPLPPSPFAVSGDLRSSGAISLSGGSGSFGTVTGSIGPNGSFQVTVSAIPGGTISSVDSSGTIMNGSINLGYTVHFGSGGSAHGTVNAAR